MQTQPLKRVLIVGATGMIGRGILMECLGSDESVRVLAVGRTPVAFEHPHLEQIVQADVADIGALADRLEGVDSCFFCVGVSSSGLDEAAYARMTHDLTLSVAQTLSRLAPDMAFVYVSAAGADSTERGPTMWARVRGRTENDLMRLPFRSVSCLRIGMVQPSSGIQSKTRAYRWTHTILSPILPLARRMYPALVLTLEEVGRAARILAEIQSSARVFEARDLRALLLGAETGDAEIPGQNATTQESGCRSCV